MKCLKLYQIRWLYFLLLLLFVVPYSPSFGQTIDVVTEEWPPYNHTENKEIVGTATKILREALNKINIPYKIRSYPWARTYNMALNNPNTLIYTIARTDHREKMFKWVTEIQPSVKVYFYKRADNTNVTATTIEEAKQHSIVAIRSSYVEQHLESLGFNTKENLVITTTPSQAIKMLMKGRVDFFAETTVNLPPILKKAKVTLKELSPTIFVMERKLFAAFSNNTDDELVKRLRSAIEEITARENTLNSSANHLTQ